MATVYTQSQLAGQPVGRRGRRGREVAGAPAAVQPLDRDGEALVLGGAREMHSELRRRTADF